MKETKTYQDAFEELQLLARKMENAEISVDKLTEMLKRATLLINICKKKLSDTEEEVKELLEKM
ncbi:MAG: exodeoxyribonuclease VII small subunit [Bacteroidales bacterium]|jgi:exodeoxyribonuclease VII small subunit|nr:exodeoxyribonuclease VII small subunit [Bacteroidales bacterium]